MGRNRFLLAFFISLLFCLPHIAWADAGVTYHGRLLAPNGKPVLATSVRFQIQIRTPSPTSCVLFEEVHIRDLSVSNGTFSITLNDGNASYTKVTGFTLSKAFRNQGTLNFPASDCIGDDEYTPSPSDGRQIFVSFNDGSFTGWEPLPPQDIAFVPMAIEAMTVGGHKAANFFRVEDAANEPQAMGAWSVANYGKLTSLIGNTTISGGVASIGGTASGFTGSLAGDVTGGQGSTTVEKIQGRSVGTTAPTDGQVLTWSNALTRWEPTTVSSSGITALTGDVTASGTGSVAATIANSAVTNAKLAANAVDTSKILDGTITGLDLDFGGANSATNSFVLKDSTTNKFTNFACTTPGHVPVWTAAGFACQAPSITETDPKVGANTTDMLSKWNGTALVASGVYENAGNVGIGTTTPTDKLEIAGRIRATHICAPDGTNCKDLSTAWAGGSVSSVTGTAPIAVTGGASTPVVSLNAAGVTTTHLADASVTDIKIDRVSVNKIQSGAGLYLTYAPNNVACANDQILKKTANGWECGTDNGLTTELDPSVQVYAKNAPSADFTTPSGVLTLATVPITKGGTGATTQQAAINNLLPSQNLQAGKILQTDGTNVSWIPTPVGGITALTGDVTASGSGSVAATIANSAVTNAKLAANAVDTSKILDGTITGLDLDFTGLNSATTSLVLKDSTGKFTNFACTTPGHVPAWTATGFACQAPSITETDPKVGANTTDMLSKWDGTALVASGVYENAGNVGIGTTTPANKLSVNGVIESMVGGIRFPDGTIQTTATGGGSGGTMLSQWPDAIRCTNGSQYWHFVLANGPWADGRYYYSGATEWVGFNPDGTYYSSSGGLSAFDCVTSSQSISTLYSLGHAYNFVGGGSNLWTASGSDLFFGGGNVGIGTTTPNDRLDVAGRIRATHICASDGSNCKDLLTSWGSGGTVTNVTAGTGLTGGNITTSGTIGLGTELAGLNALSTTGFMKRTAAGTYSTATTLDLATETTGTLAIARGGTGATTQQAAINNLLPSQNLQAGKVLQTDGTNVSWIPTPVGGITALTGDVTASGTGSVAATIANSAVTNAKLAANAVDTSKILDGTITGLDLDFGGVNSSTTSLVLKDSTGKFTNFACTTPGHVPAWTTTGFACQAPSITETDPKIGANTTNMLSKWNGTALVASGVYENGGNVGIGTTSPSVALEVTGSLRLSGAGASASLIDRNVNNGSLYLYGGQSLDTNPSSISIYGNSHASYGGNVYLNAKSTFFRSRDAITTYMAVADGGNVGIGTMTPNDRLDVAGRIRATHICASDGSNCKDLFTSWGSGGTVTNVTAGTGLTGGNITTSGTIGLGTELSALNALNTTGFMKRTAAGTYSTASTLDLATETTGTLAIARGGTGATTQQAAINNLLPSQNLQAGKILQTDGTNVSWTTAPTTGITALTGDVTASGTGSVAATIANSAVTNAKLAANAVDTSKILDGTITGLDLNFGGVNSSTTSLVLKDSTGKFTNFACTTPGHVPAWTTTGFACQAPSITETDPKVGANTTNMLSKWNGTALVASGVYENGGNVGIGTTSPNAKLTIEGPTSLRQQAADPAGTANYGSLYTKTDGKLYYRDGIGTITDLTAGGSGTPGGSTGQLQYNDGGAFGGATNIYVDNANSRLGIGVAVPTTRLSIEETRSDNTGQIYLQSNLLKVNPPAASTGGFYGGLSVASATGATSSSAYLIGYGGAVSNTTTAVGAGYGLVGQVVNSAGSMGTGNALLLDVVASGSSTINSAAGAKVSLSASSTSNISTAKGLDIEVATSGSGTITTGYGVYIERVAGSTSKFSLYAKDATAPSYFAGNVGIGTATPTVALDVNGTIKATGFSGPMTPTALSVGVGSSGSPSLNFSGDTNTGFYNASSNDTISVATGGSNIFNFTSTGLSSPTAGGANIATGLGTAAAPTYSFAGDADTGWWHPAADTLAASTGGTERIRISSSGQIGIGTTSPGQKLDIVGDNGNFAETRISTNSNTNWHAPYLTLRRARGTASAQTYPLSGDSLGVLSFRNHTSSGGSFVMALATEAHGVGASGSDLYLQTTPNGSNTAATRMYIGQNGNVGIGTTNPQSKLDVNGQIRSPSAAVTSDSIDWDQGNAITTTFDCGTPVSFANLRDGGSYTLAVTGAGPNQCDFSTATTGADGATVSYRFKPANGARQAGSHTIYSMVRIGTVIYVSWITGF